jgi:hypothetical protein
VPRLQAPVAMLEKIALFIRCAVHSGRPSAS